MGWGEDWKVRSTMPSYIFIILCIIYHSYNSSLKLLYNVKSKWSSPFKYSWSISPHKYLCMRTYVIHTHIHTQIYTYYTPFHSADSCVPYPNMPLHLRRCLFHRTDESSNKRQYLLVLNTKKYCHIRRKWTPSDCYRRRQWHPTPVLLPGKSHGQTEEPGRLQSMGSLKSWTRLRDFTFTFHFHALEKEMATHSSVLAGESQGWRSLVGCRLWGRTASDTTEAT